MCRCVSKLRYEAISLEELVRASEAIVVARPGDPFRSTEEIDLETKGAPPFLKVNLRFDVIETLKGETARAILVSQADLQGAMDVHRLEYGEHLSSQWIARAYGGGDIARGAVRILFLVRHEEQFVYTAEGSEEPV